MANADPALPYKQRSALEKLLLIYSTVFSDGPEDMGRTSLIFHKINIGENPPVCQCFRRIPHEHIPFLTNKVEKLQNNCTR